MFKATRKVLDHLTFELLTGGQIGSGGQGQEKRHHLCRRHDANSRDSAVNREAVYGVVKDKVVAHLSRLFYNFHAETRVTLDLAKDKFVSIGARSFSGVARGLTAVTYLRPQ